MCHLGAYNQQIIEKESGECHNQMPPGLQISGDVGQCEGVIDVAEALMKVLVQDTQAAKQAAYKQR